MLKTCEVCQSDYEAVRSNQKYCPDCAKNPDLSRRKLIAAEIRNKEHAGDRYKVREYTCKYCGKRFASTYGGGYCSHACNQQHIVETAKCPVCGDLLASKGRMTGKGCCSDECRDALALKTAKANGRYRACTQCGKMYIAKEDGSKFCSQPCYRQWVSVNKMDKPKPVIHTRVKYCPTCGKRFEASGQQAGMKYCSPECRRAPKPKPKPSSDKNLCITCKTSQADCEKFTSGHVYHPKGAVQKKVKGKLVVVSCPKFR